MDLWTQAVARRLQKLAAWPDMPHLLLYGPSGSGRRTLVMALLRTLYGPGAATLQVLRRRIAAAHKGGQAAEITVLRSAHHLEFTPGDLGSKDRVVMSQMVKETAETFDLGSAVQGKPGQFKVVVVHDADWLSRPAQQAARRILEQYSVSCRLIFLAESLGPISAALHSRLHTLRVAAPSPDDLAQVLRKVASLEGLELPDDVLGALVAAAQRNARRALLLMESSRPTARSRRDTGAAAAAPGVGVAGTKGEWIIQAADWQRLVRDMARQMLHSASVDTFVAVWPQLAEVVVQGFELPWILRELLRVLVPEVQRPVQNALLFWAARCDHEAQGSGDAKLSLQVFVTQTLRLLARRHGASKSTLAPPPHRGP